MTNEKIPYMAKIKKASELTGISYDCLRKMCLRNEISHIKTGTHFLINMDKLSEYLNGGTTNE